MRTADAPVTVTIHCLAYNQEPYIRRTLEGFVMQRTDFSYVAVVHDDASTDATSAIIREFVARYPDKIRPVLSTVNRYRQGGGALESVMAERMTGEYVAFCEGDDYWTDPYKLQRQVDYMRAHPDCAVCYTDVRTYHQATGEMTLGLNADAPEISDTAQELRRNRVITCSAMMRGEVLRNYYATLWPYVKELPLGDYPRWLYATLYGYIYHDRSLSAVYRMLGESASHSADRYRRLLFRLAIYDTRITFCRFAGLPGAWRQLAKRTALATVTCLAHGWVRRLWRLLAHPGYRWDASGGANR